MKRPRRRMIIILIALLVLGVIINIAVAWALVIAFDVFAPGSRGTAVRGRFDGAPWDVSVFNDPHASVRVDFADFRGTGQSGPYPAKLIPDWSTVPRSLPANASSTGLMQYHLDVASGWPARSMHVCTTDFNWDGKPEEHRYGFEISLIDASNMVPKVLPLAPIWPGFLINTLLYAGLCGLPFAPFTIRRALRRRRNLCVKCGYPIGTSPVCTECGAAIAKSVA